MDEEKDFENIDIPVEVDEATKIRDKRIRMCSDIIKKEKDNINRTDKKSDAQMAREIKDLIWRLS